MMTTKRDPATEAPWGGTVGFKGLDESVYVDDPDEGKGGQMEVKDIERLLEGAIDIHEAKHEADTRTSEEIRKEAYEAGVAAAERAIAEREARMTGKPDWEIAVEKAIQEGVDKGIDRREVERMVLNSPIFQPWKFKEEGPTILEPLKKRMKGLPQTELYSDNLTLIGYKRPSGFAGFATKEYANKRIEASKNLKDKKARLVFEDDELERQYQIIHDEAVANMYYWRWWFEKSLDVLAWKSAEREGNKAQPPRWLLDAIKSDEDAITGWRESMLPKGMTEKDGMFAAEPMSDYEKRKNTLTAPTWFTTPSGSTIKNPYEWWQGLNRQGRKEELDAAHHLKDEKERDSILKFYEFLEQKYPTDKPIDEQWKEDSE